MFASSCIFPVEYSVTDERFSSVLPFLLRYRCESVFVPCGQCSFCRGSAAAEWAYRLTDELSCSPGYFVSLHSSAAVSPADFQRFFVRLRQRLLRHRVDVVCAGGRVASTLAFKYFLTSGYAGSSSVPFYHGIFFNVPEAVVQILRDVWTHGAVYYSAISRGSSAAAVALASGCFSIVPHSDPRPRIGPLVSFSLRVERGSTRVFNDALARFLEYGLRVKVRPIVTF